LSEQSIRQFETVWLKTFGLSISRQGLSYLAHQICLLEDRCEGRLACPVETALLRLLALRSLKTKHVRVLEIGTLFGVGAGVLHRLADPERQTVNLTLLDPLDGYYETGTLDPTTGWPVTRRTLERNLATMGVPQDDWRLIGHLSTDAAALEAASDREYDLLIIDGDHSVDGVARDFELYSPLVKSGGLIIFDDYGAPEWPGIQPYVDEHLRSEKGWSWVGADWRTGIMRRKTTAKPRSLNGASDGAPNGAGRPKRRSAPASPTAPGKSPRASSRRKS